MLKGIFRQFIYKSDKGYVIGLFKVKDTDINELIDYIDKTITITGYFADIEENDSYMLKGEMINHPKYGLQFNVSESEKIKPEGKDALVEFLSSQLFKGVGEKLATKIVDILGDNALDLILEDKNNLYKVPKIPDKKVDIIYNTLKKHEESHEVIVKLTELGFSMKDSLNIYNTYKSNTVRIIENNIYRLLDDVADLTFSKIDEIVKHNKLNINNIYRIEACIIYMMNNLTFSSGDTYSTYSEIFESVSYYFNDNIDQNTFDEALKELEETLKIRVEEDRYYLFEIYESEDYISDKINYLIHKEPDKFKKIENIIKNIEKEFEIEYNFDQINAIKSSIENNITIITGGPGVGKTTIIKAITEVYKRINKLTYDELVKEIVLLAPTGRAAKRMSEATLLPASTIHRFLKWNKETDEFMVNEYNPEFKKFIIVDEVSMIDTKLMSSLLKGLTNNIKLVFVGDVNQLPSVGCGNILKDLIDSSLIDTIELELLYRQDESSYIPILANEIKNDSLEEDFINPKEDYQFLECTSDMILPSLVNIVKKVIDKGYDYKRVQLMAPMYAGINGIDNINKVLQDIFNPSSSTKSEVHVGDVIYRVGDKVLQLVNDPDNNVYNGDIGVILDIAKKSHTYEMKIDYDNTIVTYTSKDFNKIKHGFIISIHKSQGSEFELVIIPISHTYKRMLYKKLLYTGITRAKRRLILIGEPQYFYYGVKKEEERTRKTTLLDKLNEKLNNNY